MLRLHFPNGNLIIHHRASLTPARTLQCLTSEDEVRRLLVTALNDKTTLNRLRNFFAQWNSEAKRVNIINDRLLIERIARMTVNGPLAAFVVYDRHTTHPGDVESKLTAQRDGATQQSNAPGAGRSSVASRPTTGATAPVGAPTAAGAPAAAGPNTNSGVSENAALDVSHLIAEQRLEQMLKRCANYMPQTMRAIFVKVYERDMLFVTIAVMTIWARYRDLGIGGIIDALLLDATHLDAGQSIITAARKMHKAIETAIDAREEKDFELAAQLLAEVLEEIGLAHFASAIRYAADRVIQSTMKPAPEKRRPPPPPRPPPSP